MKNQRMIRWRLNLTAFGTNFRETKRFRKEWRKLRKQVLAEQKVCQVCGTKRRPEGHHIVPVHVDNSLALVKQNIIRVCRACHLAFAHRNNFRDYDPNINSLCAWLQEYRRSNQVS